MVQKTPEEAAGERFERRPRGNQLLNPPSVAQEGSQLQLADELDPLRVSRCRCWPTLGETVFIWTCGEIFAAFGMFFNRSSVGLMERVRMPRSLRPFAQRAQCSG